MVRRSRVLGFLLLFLVSTAVFADDDCRRAVSSAALLLARNDITSSVWGDFDEDGRPDVALMIRGSDRIVELNRGGVFQPLPREINALTGEPLDFGIPVVAASDVNHDGHLDLIYRDSRNPDIWVSPGRGDGTFAPPVFTKSSRTNIDQFQIVDFNHDGAVDFIDFTSITGLCTFVQSKGDGTFEDVAQVDLSVPYAQNTAMVAGDFDGDGTVDVALMGDRIVGSPFLLIAWNDGNFHFTKTIQYLDQHPSLAPVDVDGNGADALVEIIDGQMTVLRFPNRKMTTDQFAVGPAGTGIGNPIMLDVDGDGARDLVFSVGNTVGVVLGTADHRFRELRYYELPGSGSFAAVDVDHDGIVDLVSNPFVVCSDCDSPATGLFAFYGASIRAGTPNANRVYRSGGGRVALEDVDGDGIRDLVTMNFLNGMHAVVLFGDAAGGFSRASEPLDQSGGIRGAVGDFDGDGHADLAMLVEGPAQTQVMIAFGGSGGFGKPSLAIDADDLAGRVFLDPSSSALVTLKGNDVQLVTVSSGRTVTTSTICQRTSGSQVFAVDSPPGTPAAVGVVDSAGLHVFARTSNGWREETLIPANDFYPSVTKIMAADLDGNGRPDLIVQTDIDVVIFHPSADGSWRRQGVSMMNMGFLDALRPVDFDGDGRLDLVATIRGNFGDAGIIKVLRNTGTDFVPYAIATTGAPSGDMVVDNAGNAASPRILMTTWDGVEEFTDICATPRMRLAAVPANPAPGTSVTLLISPFLTDGVDPGPFTISDGGTVVATLNSLDLFYEGAYEWSSPPLSAGLHTFRVSCHDPYNDGLSSATITVGVGTTPRRHAAGH